MSYAKNNDRDPAAQAWVKDTHEARRNAMEVRRKIPPEQVRTPPFDVPDLVDYYNRLLFEYASQLRPQRDSVTELWNDELTTVDVPKDGGTVTSRSVEPNGDFDPSEYIFDAPWEAKPVSLDSLREEWIQDSSVTVTVEAIDLWAGKVSRDLTKSLYLPVWAADIVLQQCNDCLKELGWLPKPARRDLEDTDPDDLVKPESFRK